MVFYLKQVTQATDLHTTSTWRATAFLLALLLLLPSGLSFAHNFENHDHIDRCELSADVHMHENDIDCDLDTIVLHKLGVFAFAKAELAAQTLTLNQPSHYQSPVYNKAIRLQSLRGPPQISI